MQKFEQKTHIFIIEENLKEDHFTILIAEAVVEADLKVAFVVFDVYPVEMISINFLALYSPLL